MKNPLSYQATEFDCGPTTLTNAMHLSSTPVGTGFTTSLPCPCRP